MSASGCTIRPTGPADLPALKAVIAAAGLFPPDLLDGMIAPFLRAEDDAGIWLTLDQDGPLALAYCVPERMTEGTWNLLLIAVLPARHGEGLGTALVAAIEAALAPRGGRLLLAETSGLHAYARTRAFYPRCGFTEEARIRDFYETGEDKVVFRKLLDRRA